MSDTSLTAPALSQADFPPTSIAAFLHCCAGEWLSLRSRLSLGLSGDAAEPNEAEDWHSSERAELSIVYLSPDQAGEPGGLGVSTKSAPGQVTRVSFGSDGRFSSDGAQGQWTLWPDGSLDLVISTPDGELNEKIWFTKPNLRLRSTVETRFDGAPGRASFSSEIRRVSRPAA